MSRIWEENAKKIYLVRVMTKYFEIENYGVVLNKDL